MHTLYNPLTPFIVLIKHREHTLKLHIKQVKVFKLLIRYKNKA